MSTLRIKPTRMELSRTKKRLVTAKRGHKLLKDKRDELVRRFIGLAKENYKLRKETENEIRTAMQKFSMARAVMDAPTIETALLFPSVKTEIDVKSVNILSIKAPEFILKENENQKASLPYGFAEVSSDLDFAVEALVKVLPNIISLANTEKKCILLADEIEKTRRRVNALEYVMIPQFESAIRNISMKLEENERGSIVRLMKVKQIIQNRE